MTTATLSRELPRLRTDHVPLALDSATGFDIAAHYRELRDEARRARSAAEDAERAQHQAAVGDSAAASDAAYAGKKLPSRSREAKAAEDTETKRREAEAATQAANRALAEIVATVHAEPGAQLQGQVAESIEGVRARLAEHLAPVAEDVAELVGLAGFQQWLAKARKSDNGRLPAGRGQNAKSIHVNSGANDPARLVELLREWDPRWHR